MNDDLERLELPEPAARATVICEGYYTDIKWAQLVDMRRWPTGSYDLYTANQVRALLADRQVRAQAAKPVAWSVMAPGGYLYESQFTTDRSVAEKWLSPNPENLLKLRPLYTRAAPAEVTEDMVLAGARAVLDDLNGGDSAVSLTGRTVQRLVRAALEAALGGGDGHPR